MNNTIVVLDSSDSLRTTVMVTVFCVSSFFAISLCKYHNQSDTRVPLVSSFRLFFCSPSATWRIDHPGAEDRTLGQKVPFNVLLQL